MQSVSVRVVRTHHHHRRRRSRRTDENENDINGCVAFADGQTSATKADTVIALACHEVSAPASAPVSSPLQTAGRRSWPWNNKEGARDVRRRVVGAVLAGVVGLSAIMGGSITFAEPLGPSLAPSAGLEVATLVQQPSLSPEEQSVVDLFKQATPSVVYITNVKVIRDYYTLNEMEVPAGTGSGFVWDQNGFIVTNFHVIKGSADLFVTLGDQSVHKAKVVGFDKDRDIAVLKIDVKDGELKPLPLGRSASLQVGQKVFAIGNPFGLDHTLTTGVISGLGREINSGNTGRPIRAVIQTDAAINPGNSGGPLLDSAGKLIGINTAIVSPSGSSAGLGFSLPVDGFRGLVDQIIRTGKVTRPVLGLTIAPDGSLRELGFQGVLVLNAPSDGPAGQAGIRSTRRDAQTGQVIFGDVITGIDGSKIRDSSDLFRILDNLKVGQRVRVAVKNVYGDEREVKVTVGEQVSQFMS